ncbi:unnamed protein product, partial [Mesorhabditis spiculigera]
MDPPSQRGAVFLFPDPYKPGGMAVGSGCRPMESGSYQEFLKNPLNHPIYTHLPEPLRHLRAAREYEQPAMQKTPQMLPSNFYPGFFPTYPMQPQLQSPEQLQLFWAHVSHQFQHQFHPYVAQQQAVYQAALQPQPASVSYVSPVPVVEQQQPSSFHQTTPATSQASEDDWSKASCSGEEPLPDMPRLDKSIQPPSDVEDEDDFDGYEWLREHFRTRHAKGAATYKCIVDGCRGRFVTNRQLEDHVRTGHIQAAANRKERKPGDIYRPQPLRRAQPEGDRRRTRGPDWFCLEKTGSGAAWRKRRIDASVRCATIVIPEVLMIKETSTNTPTIETTDFSAKPSKQELRAALAKIQDASQRLLPSSTLSALFPAPSH